MYNDWRDLKAAEWNGKITTKEIYQEKLSDRERDVALDVAKFFVDLSGVFGHYAFFTKELWRKVKGYKDKDKGEVIAAFLNYWFHHKFGFNTMPCGCGWFAELSEETYNEYEQEWMPLFMAYADWCEKQR